MPRRLFSYLTLLPLALFACAHAAHARDWWNDPFDSDASLPKYSQGLTAPECPTLPQNGEKLGVMQTVAIVLCRNPDAKVSLHNLFAQAANVAGTYSQYMPNMSASVGWSRSTSFSSDNRSTSVGRSSGISIGYTLYDFGKRDAAVTGAEFALQAGGYGYRGQLQQLIANTLRGYYSLVTSAESVRAARESEAYSKAALAAAELRYEVGQVPLSDQLQARAAYSQAHLALQQAQNQLALAKSALARLMGMNPDVPFEVSDIDDGELYSKPLEVDIDKAMARAREIRPELLAQRATLESTRQSYRGTRRAITPTISLSGGTSAPNFNPVNRNDLGRSQSIGLSMSIPIFTGFSQTYNETAAARQLRAAEEQLNAVEYNIAQDVWQAYQNYQTAQGGWLTSLDTLASTLELKDIALGRYREGVGSILDLLNAQSQYSNSLQQNASAKYNLLATRIDLIRAIGLLEVNTVSTTPASVNAPATPATNTPAPEPIP